MIEKERLNQELNEEKRWLKKWLILYRCTMSSGLRSQMICKIIDIKRRIDLLKTKENR